MSTSISLLTHAILRSVIGAAFFIMFLPNRVIFKSAQIKIKQHFYEHTYNCYTCHGVGMYFTHTVQ